jgi:hypothetical protein
MPMAPGSHFGFRGEAGRSGAWVWLADDDVAA